MARLSKYQIREILIKNHQGVPRSQIAAQFNCDQSTVRYHIEQFERTYGSSAAVYSVIRPVQQICSHPSMKCSLCGKAQDAIRRREMDEITRLRAKLEHIKAVYGICLDDE